MADYGMSAIGALLELMRPFCRACVIVTRRYEFWKGQTSVAVPLLIDVNVVVADNLAPTRNLALEDRTPCRG